MSNKNASTGASPGTGKHVHSERRRPTSSSRNSSSSSLASNSTAASTTSTSSKTLRQKQEIATTAGTASNPNSRQGWHGSGNGKPVPRRILKRGETETFTASNPKPVSPQSSATVTPTSSAKSSSSNLHKRAFRRDEGKPVISNGVTSSGSSQDWASADNAVTKVICDRSPSPVSANSTRSRSPLPPQKSYSYPAPVSTSQYLEIINNNMDFTDYVLSSIPIGDDVKEFSNSFISMAQASNKLLQRVKDLSTMTTQQAEEISSYKEIIKSYDLESEEKEIDLRRAERELEAVKFFNSDLLKGKTKTENELADLTKQVEDMQRIIDEQNAAASNASNNVYSVLNSDEKIETAAEVEERMTNEMDSAIAYLKKNFAETEAEHEKKYQELTTKHKGAQKQVSLLQRTNDDNIHELAYMGEMMSEMKKMASKYHAALLKLEECQVKLTTKKVETPEIRTESPEIFFQDMKVRLDAVIDQVASYTPPPPESESASVEIAALKEKLAAKEEAVTYFKSREKELVTQVADVNEQLTEATDGVLRFRNELSKVKANYLTYLKKAKEKEKNKLDEALLSSAGQRPELSESLSHLIKDSKSPLEAVTIHSVLQDETYKHIAIEKELKRENLKLHREIKKLKGVAAKLLAKPQADKTLNNRSKQREERFAIVEVERSVTTDGVDPKEFFDHVTKTFVAAKFPLLSIKRIMDNLFLLRTKDSFNEISEFSLHTLMTNSTLMFHHVSVWHQLIVHNVPMNSEERESTIVETSRRLRDTFYFNSNSGPFANTIVCRPRFLNPLEYYSRKPTASLILSYSSLEIYENALRHGITIHGSKRALRTEPLVGALKNIFHQAGFFAQFFDLRTEEMMNEAASAIEAATKTYNHFVW
ncbi:hypothetical protein D0Z00_004635 [Geotrichum galactomycetum]|uniref:Uncharacterized protein n=1 Tax=Geotrichum galactomycetum TaxID=27317 RepID=A0ACB6UXW0_9ASCO|nr:hypothetical protein D0Z00_004635 [Geotrichum candidum]